MGSKSLRTDEAGFTLLEVIVAFTVLALSLVAINRSVALATTQIRRAEEVRRAEELAQEILTDIILSKTAVPAAARGASDAGLLWRLSGVRIGAGRIPITRIRLEIFADSGRRVRDYTTFVPREAAEK